MWGWCGKVYGVSGEVCWRVGKECGEGNGKDVGKCAEVRGPNTLLIPHISLPSPFPTSPLTSPYTPSHFPTPPFVPLPTSLLPPPTPQHIFLLSPHLPSPSQSVAKLPCDEVCVAKLLWRSYHVAKLLATISSTSSFRCDTSYNKAFVFVHGNKGQRNPTPSNKNPAIRSR